MRLNSLIIVCVLTMSLGMGRMVAAQEQSVSDAQSVTETVTETATEAAEPEPSPEELAALQKKEEEKLRMHSDFARFSDTWVARLNRSHSNGYNKMRFIQDGDMVRARYHRIEKRSSVVRESPSQPGHYCGILRYQDTVYEAVGTTKQECRAGEFIPVAGTARAFSEIFQFKNGAWR